MAAPRPCMAMHTCTCTTAGIRMAMAIVLCMAGATAMHMAMAGAMHMARTCTHATSVSSRARLPPLARTTRSHEITGHAAHHGSEHSTLVIFVLVFVI